MLLDVTLPGGVPLLGQLPPSSRVPRISRLNAWASRCGGAGRPVHGGPARPGHTERDQWHGRVRLYRYFDTLRVPGATKTSTRRDYVTRGGRVARRPSSKQSNTCILDKGLVPYSMSRFFGSPTDLKSSSIWYDATPFFWTR